MLGRIDDYFRPQETALKLRSLRQEVLASNIANADTPQYKARDFDFEAAFKAATAKQAGGALATTDARHLQPKNTIDPLSPELMYRNPYQASIDGNTVEMDNEMRQFSDNAVRYQAAITFMQRRIEGLRGAIQNQ
ncbi:flagellar basal body rod protein FlgB [Chitiniphilus shinanonensis]|uniref:Flagellar basal body rod protein FlgB n=1 Tax=Chitiniphilus shinanonensis TaxID=553088 RepID=A0ABQ6BSB4_9NEIS|nr:flagellar basal body rod protein FlgB [Chitiniphilus shinanonensis]GLS04332.1 flagellar basal body rod protein FlgB [Chitiniphilus shinanonensis]